MWAYARNKKQVFMEIIKRTDAILSIIVSLVTIGTAGWSRICMPSKHFLFLILAIVVSAGTIVYLIVKVVKLKKEMSTINQCQAVPYFKSWYLMYTLLWRKHRNLLHNNVIFDEIHIKRYLHGGDEKHKDNTATYRFKGKYKGNASCFLFCIGGLDGNDITLEKVNFHAYDKRTDQELPVSLDDNIPDGMTKFVRVSYIGEKLQGDYFDLELSWTWPKTMYANADYFVFPNCYGNQTKKLTLEFSRSEDMNLKFVGTYKLGLKDENPVFIKQLNGVDSDMTYIHEIDNPEQDADYITYYD